MIPRLLIPLLLATGAANAQTATTSAAPANLSKVQDVVIYRDETFYSAFPSVVRRADGEVLVAFRRAPERRNFGNAAETHTDPCAQLVLVRSRDEGKTWTQQPQLVFAHPRAGLQDPCMLRLNDGSILCSSYGWALVPRATSTKLKNPARADDFVSIGGVMLKSGDGGTSWSEIALPATPGETYLGPFNEPLPPSNRGAMCQGKDGRVFWVTVMEDRKTKVIGTHLFISSDRGVTWTYSCPVATDEKITFNETSVYETPGGDLVAFMRTENFGDHTVVARSADGGKSFQKWQDAGFMGHPHHALRLPDDRVLLTYGYRHAPYGIRARVLNAECSDFTTAAEIVLRADGGHGDLGYPWSTMVADDRVLVVYYFNENNGPRYIAGTLLRIGAQR